jgi:lipid-binding SYLF domain-containing protein
MMIPTQRFCFFGQTKGAFAGFGLDGATLKADGSGDKMLYGKSVMNKEIVEGQTGSPGIAQPFVAQLTNEISR